VGAAVASAKVFSQTEAVYILELGPPKNTESEDIYLVPADHWEEADRR
jgi:hypothetical protein